MAACLPDSDAERAHLVSLIQARTRQADALPACTLPADVRPADVRPADVRPADVPSARPDADRAAGVAGCALLAWARSGLMALTGRATEVPLTPAAPVLARADAIVSAIADLADGRGRRLDLDLHQVLAGRAAEAGWRRHGAVSANGTCQLLPAADGWLAVNLARPVDVRSLPAVLGRDLAGEPWTELRAEAAGRPAAELVAAAQRVGIPAAVLGGQAPPPLRLSQVGERVPPPAAHGLVVDLSAMWAGPLCASILGHAGWRVVKVEDSRRPDGARSGPPGFYASLHAGQPIVQLDFGSAAGRAELLRLADKASVVVESSRPRALQRLGLSAADWLRAAPGRTWVSVTGYGRDDPEQRVAFGDDAGVAGGLVAYAADGAPVFCGDAIADPLTGLYAGLAALAAHAAGGGVLVDVAMAGVTADIARPSAGPLFSHVVRQAGEGWIVSHGDRTELVRAP